MKRKVIKQGHNTLTITLPSKWAMNYGVKPGDEIDVVEQEKSLVINTDGNGAIPSSTTIDISNLSSPLIWRYILSAYRAGYDEIRVTGIGTGKKSVYSAFSYNTLDYLKDSKQSRICGLNLSPMETVSAVVNRLIGVEIIDQKSNQCIIKEMSDVTDKEFGNALRRIFILLQTETESIKNGFSGKTDDLKAIHLVDTNLDRFEDFCFRVLNKKGYSIMRKTNTMHSLIFTLEMLGDELKKIAIHMLEDRGKYTKLISDIFSLISDQFDRFYKLFYKFSKELAVDIYKKDNEATEFTLKNLKAFNNDERELLHHIKKIGIYVLSLTELRIDMEF